MTEIVESRKDIKEVKRRYYRIRHFQLSALTMETLALNEINDVKKSYPDLRNP